MWKKDCGFTGDTIASFDQGVITIAGMELHAKRGPQESIFLFAKHHKYSKNSVKTLYMAGISGYGWDDPLPRLLKAAKKKTPKGAQVMMGVSYEGPGKEFEVASLWWYGKKGKIGKVVHDWIKLPRRKYLEARWTGITKPTVREFFKWLEEQIEEAGPEAWKWFKKIKQKKAARFNQGDAYFARAFKKPIPNTKPGKATEPILMKRIKQMGKKEKNP